MLRQHVRSSLRLHRTKRIRKLNSPSAHTQTGGLAVYSADGANGYSAAQGKALAFGGHSGLAYSANRKRVHRIRVCLGTMTGRPPDGNFHGKHGRMIIDTGAYPDLFNIGKSN